MEVLTLPLSTMFLTDSFLFQAKRLEQALVSRQTVVHEESGRLGILEGADADRGGGLGDCHRGLRGRSSLRLAGEALPRHTPRHAPRVPRQTRTWSSIETIAAPSEVRNNSSRGNMSSKHHNLLSQMSTMLIDMIAGMLNKYLQHDLNIF